MVKSGKGDLELSQLPYFTGTMQYVNVMGVLCTDGVRYIMENGYSWFVTDLIVVIKNVDKVVAEPFLSIKLKVDGSKADVIIGDGNGKELHRQHYNYTDAKRSIDLYYYDNVLMLSSEY